MQSPVLIFYIKQDNSIKNEIYFMIWSEKLEMPII